MGLQREREWDKREGVSEATEREKKGERDKREGMSE